jgi:hypothetical protein
VGRAVRNRGIITEEELMKSPMLSVGLFGLALVVNQMAIADDRDRNHDDEKLTIAVFGDWPYSQNLLDKAKLLTDSVNADRDVSLVIHVGDIHSGSMPCTSAGILPPIPKSNPGWNQAVYYVFQQFKAPVVYTPGRQRMGRLPQDQAALCRRSAEGIGERA